jgi:hypothetical protein
MSLAALCKSPQRLRSDADITELLGFRNKAVLSGDLNAKHLVWDSSVSKSSGVNLLELFFSSKFKISDPQCHTHYTPDRRTDVLDTVAHQNIRLLEAIVTNTGLRSAINNS